MAITFEAGAVFKLTDEVSPTLARLSREMTKFNDIVELTRKNISGLARAQFGGLNARLKALTAQTDALGKSLGGTFTKMDSGIASAIADTRILAGEWRAVEAAAAAAARAVGGAGIATTGGRRGSTPGHSRSGLHVSSLGVPTPGGHAYIRGGSNAAMGGAAAIAYGVYEEAEIEKAGKQAVWISSAGALPDQTTQAAQQKQFRAIIMDTAAKTGKPVKELADAALVEIRQGSGFSWGQRMQGLPGLLETASAEADIKGTTIHEAAESLVAYAHMLKVYDPVEMQKLYPGLSYLSIRDPATLKRITTAAGYHVPTTTAGLEIDPIQEMVLQTALSRAGILNTKSGTWLRETALRALPPLKDKTKPEVYEQKMDALRELGLVDAKGKPTWFVDGKPDELKMIKTVAEHVKNIPVERRALLERFLFGAQGAGAIAVLADPKLLPQLDVMEKEAKEYKQGTAYFKYMGDSPTQAFNQTWADLRNVLMDIGQIVLPPLNTSLHAFDDILKGIQASLPKGGNGTIASNAVTGAGAGAAIGWTFGHPLAGAAVGAAVGVDMGDRHGPSGAGFLGAVENLIRLIGHYLSSEKVQISTTLNVDGRKIAEAVTEHQVREGTSGTQGSPYFDTTQPATMPVDTVSPW